MQEFDNCPHALNLLDLYLANLTHNEYKMMAKEMAARKKEEK